MDNSGAKDRYKKGLRWRMFIEVSLMAPEEKIPDNQADSSLLTENVHRL